MRKRGSEEERVERKGADTSVAKKKHERNPMIQEQKEDEKKPTHGKKAKVNSIGHQWAVCRGIKDGRWIIGMNSFGDLNPGKPAKQAHAYISYQWQPSRDFDVYLNLWPKTDVRQKSTWG